MLHGIAYRARVENASVPYFDGRMQVNVHDSGLRVVVTHLRCCMGIENQERLSSPGFGEIFLSAVVITLKKHENGRHGGGHGKGKGSDSYERHGPQGKKGVNHLPPEKRPQRHREQHDGKRRKRS